MIELVALIVHADPVSCLAWLVLAFAGGMYPLGLMLGSPCSSCCGCPQCLAPCSTGSVSTVKATLAGFGDLDGDYYLKLEAGATLFAFSQCNECNPSGTATVGMYYEHCNANKKSQFSLSMRFRTPPLPATAVDDDIVWLAEVPEECSTNFFAHANRQNPSQSINFPSGGRCSIGSGSTITIAPVTNCTLSTTANTNPTACCAGQGGSNIFVPAQCPGSCFSYGVTGKQTIGGALTMPTSTNRLRYVNFSLSGSPTDRNIAQYGNKSDEASVRWAVAPKSFSLAMLECSNGASAQYLVPDPLFPYDCDPKTIFGVTGKPDSTACSVSVSVSYWIGAAMFSNFNPLRAGASFSVFGCARTCRYINASVNMNNVIINYTGPFSRSGEGSTTVNSIADATNVSFLLKDFYNEITCNVSPG